MKSEIGEFLSSSLTMLMVTYEVNSEILGYYKHSSFLISYYVKIITFLKVAWRIFSFVCIYHTDEVRIRTCVFSSQGFGSYSKFMRC